MEITAMEIMFIIFTFIGGFGMFLYGMHVMADGLQKSAGDHMKDLIGKLTNNRLLAVITGAGVTAIIQSSSACTVMVVGFVNAGLLTLTQAVGVIMGANIGTTITSWIVSSSEWFVLFKPTQIAPLAIGVGAIMLFFSKSKTKRHIGEVIIGFGLLFIGIDFMKEAISPFKHSPVFTEAFVNFGKNPFLGIFVGFAVTAIIQSSSASVGILQTVAILGLVPWNAAIYIILGQNIGTCVTAMLSSIGASRTAKRAAVIHLLFNVIGSAVFAVGTFVYFTFVNPALASTVITSLNISIFHTVFNVSNTAMLFFFAPQLVRVSDRLVRGQDIVPITPGEIALRHLDERILETPSFAVENAVKEVVYMGEVALENTKNAVEAFKNNDLDLIRRIMKTEEDLNKLEELITGYLIKISNTSLSEAQQLTITNLFHTVTDIERIGDHAENIADLAKYYHENEIKFSDSALAELEELSQITLNTISASIEARQNNNIEAVRTVKELEERVDIREREMREEHIRRLAANKCSPTYGVVFIEALTNLERISDHANNIAEYVENESN